MAHSHSDSTDHDDADQQQPPKSSSRSKSKNKSKAQAKTTSDKSIKAKDKKESEERATGGGAWVHKNTLFLIDEIKHQMELGKGNDGGLKTDAWKTVLHNYNDKFNTNEPLTRLKNHFQKVIYVSFPSFLTQLTPSFFLQLTPSFFICSFFPWISLDLFGS